MDWKNKETKIRNIVNVFTYLISFLSFFIVYKYISPIYSFSFLFLFLISLYFDIKNHHFFPRWLVNILSLVFVALLVLRINLDDPVVPLIETLLILLSLKLIEEKRYRDYMQIYTISILLLAGSSLLSVSIIFIFYLALLLFMITSSVILLSYFSAGKDVKLKNGTIIKILLKTVLIPVLSIPLTVLIFVILPRTNYPILNFLNHSGQIRTGFSDSVSLGSVSSIQEDSSLIFRVKVKKIRGNQLYWRGFVFDYFDGKKWYKKNQENFNKDVNVKGERIKQIVYLEPYDNKYLFALDKPVYISLQPLEYNRQFVFWTEKENHKKIKYEAVSVLTDKIYQKNINPDIYLQLPDNISPKIKKLVQEFTIGKNQKEILQLFYNFLNSPDFNYSLTELPKTDKPIEEFIFNTKKGNCEFFASALAVMLRLAGIPSRLVAGYKGGYYNDLGGYYIVLQKNAHIWVEAYIDNYWIRVDPTPASLDFFTGLNKKNILFKISVLFDTINYYWTEMVVNYNLQKQVSFFKNAKNFIKKPKIQYKIEKDTLLKLFSALLISGIIFAVVKLVIIKRNPERFLINTFLKKMEKHDYTKSENEGLEEFVKKIKEEELKDKAKSFVEIFQKRFYKDEKLSKEDIRKIKKILKEI